MKSIIKYEIVAVISIVIAVFGQLSMKWGLSQFSGTSPLDLNLISSNFLNLYVILGLLCYAIAMFIWLYALKGLPLSYAYPIQSIGIVLIFLFSWLWLKESISIARWTGLIIVLTGIYFLTSKKNKVKK